MYSHYLRSVHRTKSLLTRIYEMHEISAHSLLYLKFFYLYTLVSRQAYGELKGIQETIRALKVSPDAQELAGKIDAQEHLHQRCSKLAAVLTTRLRVSTEKL